MLLELAFMFFIEVGYIEEGFVSNTPHRHVYENHTLYTHIDGELQLGPIFLGGGIQTYIHPTSRTLSYHPFISAFDGRGGLRFDWVEFGYRHRCIHPTIPNFERNHQYYLFDGFRDQFYMRAQVGRR